MTETLLQGQFRVLRRLAAGGMGEVLLAETPGTLDISPGILVVKRILPAQPGQPPHESQVEMLREEARLGLRLVHDNIVETFRYDEDGKIPLLSMEFLAGRSMAQVLGQAKKQKTPVPIDVSLKILRGAACGLHFAHTLKEGGKDLGLVHRDVSPANIFVTFDGRVKVIDFGVAKSEDSELRTATGILKGKLGYMSPEQALGAPHLTPQADVWSLGVYFWECLLAERLFSTNNPTQTLMAIGQKDIIRPSTLRADVTPDVEAICMRMVERDLRKRFVSCADIVRAIDGVVGRARLASADLGLLVAQRFPEEADAGRADAARAAKLRRKIPIPTGLIEGSAVVHTEDAASTTVISAELRRQVLSLVGDDAVKAEVGEDAALVTKMISVADQRALLAGDDVASADARGSGARGSGARDSRAGIEEVEAATKLVPQGARAQAVASAQADATLMMPGEVRERSLLESVDDDAATIVVDADTVSRVRAATTPSSVSGPLASQAAQVDSTQHWEPPPHVRSSADRRPVTASGPRPATGSAPHPATGSGPGSVVEQAVDVPKPRSGLTRTSPPPPQSTFDRVPHAGSAPTPAAPMTYSSGLLRANAKEAPSWVSVALATFGALAVVLGAAFSFLVTNPEPRTLHVYTDPAGYDIIVSDPAQIPPGAQARVIDTQAPVLLKEGDPQQRPVDPDKLRARLQEAGLWARAALPSDPRGTLAALLPLLMACVGLLALSIAAPAFVVGSARRRTGLTALLIAATLALSGLALHKGALSWPGLAAWNTTPKVDWR